MFIGRWLGPAIYVSTAMTYNILRPDGGYVCRSTVRTWTSNEEANPVRMAESELGSSRKILKSGCPKPLWDHCIEFEALIRSHTDLYIYGLEGQVSETVMSGQTGDISSLCEF